MEIQFYQCDKSGKFNRDLYGRIIDWWTRRQFKKRNRSIPDIVFTHVELVFSDGVSLSARPDGVQFKYIDYNQHRERWIGFSMNISPNREAQMRLHARDHIGQGYDWKGIILDQVFKTGLHGKHQWWCSEIVAHILGVRPELVNPTELYLLLVNEYKMIA